MDRKLADARGHLLSETPFWVSLDGLPAIHTTAETVGFFVDFLYTEIFFDTSCPRLRSKALQRAIFSIERWESRAGLYLRKLAMFILFNFMFVAVVGSLILAGLLCCWISLRNMIRLDGKPAADPVQQSGEEAPKLTRLGRPVQET